jgi:transglutaminase-like putative cysteine protease
MTVQITARFAFEFDQPSSALLQFEAAALPEQELIEVSANISSAEHIVRVPAQDGIGERIWLRAAGRVEVDYAVTGAPRRVVYPLEQLAALSPYELPGEAVQYLLDSRYCRADQYQSFTASEFAGTSGGARIDAIRQWIADRFEYVPGASDANTDATDSFIARRGICRDYTHVLVTLARASTIPARYVACYAPGVSPQDFHAVAEVFLADPAIPGGGVWQLVDATGMADLANAMKIGVGRDAADVSFLTTFAPMRFLYSFVGVTL